MRRATRIASTAFLVATLLLARAQAAESAPQRKVDGNAIVSAHDPAARIEVPTAARYVGADRWVLYGMADCELHVFVEADDRKNVTRLYWIQFESYLPSRPELHHRYESKRRARLGGTEFIVDTWVERGPDEPGSDSEHIKALVDRAGYRLPEGMIAVRFVRLLDAAKRKELMIIYQEDSAATGYSAADLRAGGKARDQWDEVAEALAKRGAKAIALRR